MDIYISIENWSDEDLEHGETFDKKIVEKDVDFSELVRIMRDFPYSSQEPIMDHYVWFSSNETMSFSDGKTICCSINCDAKHKKYLIKAWRKNFEKKS